MLNIFRLAILATGAFLISIFSMTNIFMMTTEGYPFEVKNEDLTWLRALGALSYLIGIICITLILALFGWTRSKGLGWFSTTVGLLSLILILMMML